MSRSATRPSLEAPTQQPATASKLPPMYSPAHDYSAPISTSTPSAYQSSPQPKFSFSTAINSPTTHNLLSQPLSHTLSYLHNQQAPTTNLPFNTLFPRPQTIDCQAHPNSQQNALFSLQSPFAPSGILLSFQTMPLTLKRFPSGYEAHSHQYQNGQQQATVNNSNCYQQQTTVVTNSRKPTSATHYHSFPHYLLCRQLTASTTNHQYISVNISLPHLFTPSYSSHNVAS